MIKKLTDIAVLPDIFSPPPPKKTNFAIIRQKDEVDRRYRQVWRRAAELRLIEIPMIDVDVFLEDAVPGKDDRLHHESEMIDSSQQKLKSEATM